MRAASSVLPVLLLLTACSIGTTGRSYAPATGPAGAIVKLDLTGQRRVNGELLAVEDTTLLVLQEQQLVRIAIPLIQSGKAPKVAFTGRTLTQGHPTRDRLRLISRYPQGVSPALEARLLEAYKLTGVREIS